MPIYLRNFYTKELIKVRDAEEKEIKKLTDKSKTTHTLSPNLFNKK